MGCHGYPGHDNALLMRLPLRQVFFNRRPGLDLASKGPPDISNHLLKTGKMSQDVGSKPHWYYLWAGSSWHFSYSPKRVYCLVDGGWMTSFHTPFSPPPPRRMLNDLHLPSLVMISIVNKKGWHLRSFIKQNIQRGKYSLTVARLFVGAIDHRLSRYLNAGKLVLSLSGPTPDLSD